MAPENSQRRKSWAVMHERCLTSRDPIRFLHNWNRRVRAAGHAEFAIPYRDRAYLSISRLGRFALQWKNIVLRRIEPGDRAVVTLMSHRGEPIEGVVEKAKAL